MSEARANLKSSDTSLFFRSRPTRDRRVRVDTDGDSTEAVVVMESASLKVERHTSQSASSQESPSRFGW